MARLHFDKLDLKILNMLSRNARKPFLEIARECNVSGAAIHQRIQKLESIPEIVECHFTTGKYDIFVKVYTKSNEGLLSFIQEKLLPLGIGRTETIISFREGFRRQVPILPENG